MARRYGSLAWRHWPEPWPCNDLALLDLHLRRARPDSTVHRSRDASADLADGEGHGVGTLNRAAGAQIGSAVERQRSSLEEYVRLTGASWTDQG